MSDDEGEAAAASSSGAADADSTNSRFMTIKGPQPGVKYPLNVLYCDVCDGWPLEFTEYHPNYAAAKDWMEQNLTDDMKALFVAGGGTVSGGGDTSAGDGEEGKKKRQTRGGRGVVKTRKKQEVEKKICISRAPRGKKKFVTVVTGLRTCDIDLKVASKFFASKFSCGSSVTGDDEIVIQGDVKDDLWDILPDKWPEIDEDVIDDLGDQKR